MSIVEMLLCTPFFIGAIILVVSGWEALLDARKAVAEQREYRRCALGRAKEARDAVAR
ncbi:MAG: hypothetical protein R2720_12380 [Candidatus Nanopelagicales bacterium]